MKDPHHILQEYWGYSEFRPLQLDIIQSVLQKKDVLALLPTGGGKSICFQVPAMAMEGICIVVSPLIALMKDQVENLKKRGIYALAMYTGMPFAEMQKTMRNAAHGNFKFLYVSPERLETRIFREWLPALKPCLIAVDESHCISQWGYDFRPSYLRIAEIRESLPGVPVLALTASATRMVQDDICEKLLFNHTALRFQQSFARPNLSYRVMEPATRMNTLIGILQKIPGTAIVYCRTRKQTQAVSENLQLHKIPADHYHAGLKAAERAERQEAWISNRTRVMVSTNAFGMGIDKPDVRCVVHYDLPDCIENYYQEAGRAGRDGKSSWAILFSRADDLARLKDQVLLRYPDAATLKTIYFALMNHWQVAAGSGEGQVLPIDLPVFSKNFSLNPVQVAHTLSALESEGFWTLSESVFQPSVFQFTTDKETLESAETTWPELNDTIKGLLRAYQGILDYPTSIREKELARFIGIPESELIGHLNILQKRQWAEYSPATDQPRVYLHRNRMYQDGYHLDMTAYLERKKRYADRVQSFTDYVTEKKQCRAVWIGRYFNDLTITDCGICDNCLRKKEKGKPIAAERFKALETAILQALSRESLHYKQLLHQMKASCLPEELETVVNFLLSENRIASDPHGRLSLGKPLQSKL